MRYSSFLPNIAILGYATGRSAVVRRQFLSLAFLLSLSPLKVLMASDQYFIRIVSWNRIHHRSCYSQSAFLIRIVMSQDFFARNDWELSNFLLGCSQMMCLVRVKVPAVEERTRRRGAICVSWRSATTWPNNGRSRLLSSLTVSAPRMMCCHELWQKNSAAYLHGQNALSNAAKLKAASLIPAPRNQPVFNHLLMGPLLARIDSTWVQKRIHCHWTNGDRTVTSFFQ